MAICCYSQFFQSSQQNIVAGRFILEIFNFVVATFVFIVLNNVYFQAFHVTNVKLKWKPNFTHPLPNVFVSNFYVRVEKVIFGAKLWIFKYYSQRQRSAVWFKNSIFCLVEVGKGSGKIKFYRYLFPVRNLEFHVVRKHVWIFIVVSFKIKAENV